VLGFGVGVYAVGKTSDLLKPQFAAESPRYTMIAYNALNPLAIVHGLAAARAMRRAAQHPVDTAK